MGALYVDGIAQRTPQLPGYENIPHLTRRSSCIVIGNEPAQYPECRITWNVVDGMQRWSKTGKLLIANRVLLTGVTEKSLALFFNCGTVVFLKGNPYLCRVPYIGSDENDTFNEWDDALNNTTEANNAWHWQQVGTIGQETATAARGFYEPRGWIAPSSSYQAGFRPILEPIDTLHDNADYMPYPEFEDKYAELGIPRSEIKEIYLRLEGINKDKA